jgi:hypothetical protein
MKKITFFLLLFVANFYTNAQMLTVQNEDCLPQQISKVEAREMIKAAAFSLMKPLLEETLKQAINIEKNNPEAYIEVPATCFAPDTDPALVEAFYQNRTFIGNSLGIPDPNSRYNLGGRWSSTATNGGGLGQGDLTTLTWSYVPDGTAIGNGGCGVPDQGTFTSDFIAFFNGIYGPPTTPGDFTTAPWHNVFINMFNSWSTVSGLIFVYEPNDDGVTVVTGGGGIVGTRGDMRISGHRLDGNSGVLACNYFPNNGDMIIDTADSFFGNNPGTGTINVLTHEIGHGIGIAHVCPANQTKLMEPFISFAFQGPQEDDILAANRHYGDPDGGNDSPVAATFLGANANPTSYSKSQSSIDDNGDTDYFSFTVSESTTLSGTPTPTGTTYLNGVQNPNGSCSAGTSFSASTVADVMLEILGPGGVTVLATANANGAGTAETVSGVSLPAAGTYFVRISQQGVAIDDVQMYDLNLNLVTNGADNPPTAVCMNFTAQLNAAGNATIVPANVDGGSSDPEGPVILSVSPTSFTCTDIGDNTVTLTVTDSMGQTDTCMAIVTVEDNLPPTALCQNFTVQLDASGNAFITGADIDNGSIDNCGIASLAVTPSAFTCADIGANTVTLTVTDVDGNMDTCTSTVTVEDNMLPNAICQDFTAQLDASGNVTITTADINNGSNDNCSIASLAVSPSTFTCADVGANTVTLTVTDVDGNIDTCTSTVTVEDSILPNAICQDITVQIDSSCSVTITAADIDNGSNDTCGIASLAITPSSFTCADEGPNTVTLTVTDVNGNVSTCTSIVTIERILGLGDTTTGLWTVDIFPNPANKVVTISNPQSIALEEVIIYDMLGRIVSTYNVRNTGNEATINISKLQSANYILIIKGVEGQITKRLTKK